jgi:hypothetical protein
MGPEMMDDFEAQAARFGAKMRPENVERVDLSERPFKLWAEGEDEPVLARASLSPRVRRPSGWGSPASGASWAAG